MGERRILMGVIGRPHGVRGQVHVHSYAEDLTAYDRLEDEAGRVYALRWLGDGVAEVAEIGADGPHRIADRQAAALLTNTRLYVERSSLPPTEEDEFYVTDLVGMAAFGRDGQALGRVTAVHNYGAGASLEIERSGAAPMLVPFTRSCVPEVDLAGARLTLDPPEPVGVVASEAAA